MTEQLLVSVVMPVFDPDPAYLREAVDSVLCQTLRDFELVIVEDPSPRSAEGVLRQLDDPRVRYFRNERRLSMVESLNLGLSYAKADLVARIDADDVCHPQRLEKQIEYLRAHPEISVLGTQLAVIDRHGSRLGYRAYPTDSDAIRKAMPRFNPLAHPSVVYRKAAVIEAGGYRYPVNEDYELWCRLAQRGVRFANLAEPLLLYRMHPAAGKSAKLLEVLQGTIDIKRMYWRGQMDLGSRVRIGLEQMLLHLPTPLIYRLFAASQFTRRLP